MAAADVQQRFGAPGFGAEHGDVAQRGLGHVDRVPGQAGTGAGLGQRLQRRAGCGDRDQRRFAALLRVGRNLDHVDAGTVDGEVDQVFQAPADRVAPFFARQLGGVERQQLVLAVLHDRHGALLLQGARAPQLSQGVCRLVPGHGAGPAQRRPFAVGAHQMDHMRKLTVRGHRDPAGLTFSGAAQAQHAPLLM